MQQNYESEFNSTPENSGNVYSDTTTTNGNSVAAGGKIAAVKEKFTGQANALKQQLSERASTFNTQVNQRVDTARVKASKGLRSTGERFQNIASYMEAHDAKDMSDTVARTSRELVRKYPGRSLLIGLAVGMLVGRIFAMGSHAGHRHHYQQ